MLKIEDRGLVIPGQILEEGFAEGEKRGINFDYLHCFRDKEKIISSVIGMGRVDRGGIKVIPSSGVYMPKEEDVILAVVMGTYFNRWALDINSPYSCIMSLEEAVNKGNDRHYDSNSRSNLHPRDYFDIGDILSVKISSVNEVNFSRAIKPWKLEGGLILEVDPKRVPRVIGKKRSMLNLIKEKTQSSIIVGQNGRIWIKGSHERFVVEVIKKIVREAQTSGLTDRIDRLLDNERR